MIYDDIVADTIARLNELINDDNNNLLENIIINHKIYMMRKNNYHKNQVVTYIKHIVLSIIHKNDIDLVIPRDFAITVYNNNDNINRIIYWAYYNVINENDNAFRNNKDLIIKKHLFILYILFSFTILFNCIIYILH